MKQFVVFFLLVIQTTLLLGAQFEIVSDLEEEPLHMGLYDLDNNLKLDNRNKLGALVIINCGLKDVFFKNMNSKISQINKGGSYWVVLKERAKYIILAKDGFADHRYDFPYPLVSGKVYKMTLDEKNKQADSTTLVITSNQDNSSVYVDDKLVGKTENKIFTIELPLGANEIELRKSGYKNQKITHQLSPENNRLEINLQASLPVAVTINSQPEGARVYIDNVLFGITPKSSFFNEGTYPIRIEKESFETIEDIINVIEPEVSKSYNLKDLRASLTINTSPQARISLNGNEYKLVKDMKMPASVVEIEISQAKAKSIKRLVTLKQKETLTLDLFPEIERGNISVVTIPTTASIELMGDAGEHYTAIGRKSFTDIPVGNYELIISNDGYKTHKETIKLTADNTVQKQFSLEEGSDVPDGFVYVQGGTFQMGSKSGDSDEKPVHSVTLSDFFISKYEVTQAEWQEIMENDPSHFKGNNNPVEKVSWYDAVDFCNKKSLKDGLEPVYSGSGKNIKCDFSKNGYRLPTEAEWEFAARGGNKSKGYTYSGSNNIDEVAEYEGNNNKSTKAVGGKKPNELGIYDMSGNVWEWCWDWYGDYSSSAQTDPLGPNSGSNRVKRGGSWIYSAAYCRVAFRISSNPTYSSNSGIGFRLARSSN